MSCGDELDAAEAEYLAALEAVDSASFDDEGRLVLSGDDVNLVYDTYDAADVIVGEWHIVNVATEQAIEGVPEGVDPVLVVEEPGDLSVTGLCNTLGATWELDGDQLSITPPISTLMACEPPELMQTESAIGAALARADTVSVTPDMLTIFDESGAIVIVATANPA